MQTIAMHNSGIFGRPIPIVTFILNHHFFGADPIGYKMINLFIHFINTLLVYFLVSMLLHLFNRVNGNRIHDYQIGIIVVLTTIFWAIHPLQVSSVLYVFQRMTLLSTLFSLLALITYVSAKTESLNDKPPSIILFVTFPCLLGMAIASKENGILIVAYVALIEFIVFRKHTTDTYNRNYWMLFNLLFIIIPVIVSVSYLITHVDTILEGYKSRDFTLLDRLRTELVVLVFYLKLIITPNVSDMSLYHDAFPRFKSMDAMVIASGLIIAIMGLCTFIFRKKAPILAFGLGFFIIAHSLESTFIPLELVFEHRNYLALLGIITPCIWYLMVALNKLKSTKVACAVLAIPFILISGQTYSRSTEWSSEIAMNTLAVENHPESLRARTILITTLSNHNRHNEANQLLSETKLKFPKNPALHLLGLAVNCNSGHIVGDAIQKTKQLLTNENLDQNVPNTINALMSMAAANTCHELSFDMLAELTNIAVNNPNKVMPNVFIGNLYALDAQLKLSQDYSLGAVESLMYALEAVPNHPEILIVLTSQLTQLNRFSEAKNYLSRLKEINKRKFSAYSEAVAHLERSISHHSVYSEEVESR